MKETVGKRLRNFVILRAGGRCEYCRLLAYLANFDFHIEHIIGLQHGGLSLLTNLAYACSWCNWKKGPNIATILSFGGALIPLFNPRTQNWFDHFEVFSTGWLHGKTEIGMATIKLLDMNHPDKMREREQLILAGVYP